MSQPNFEMKEAKFDLAYQRGVLNLALRDDYFAAQLIKYLAKDNDSRKVNIFTAKEYQIIFDYIVKNFDKYGTRPSEGNLRQHFASFALDEQSELSRVYQAILSSHEHDDDFYRETLTQFIQTAKMVIGFAKIQEQWGKNKLLTPGVMQSVVDEVFRIHLEKDDVILLKDVKDYASKVNRLKEGLVPTGIKELDETLNGGLPRGELVVVLGGTNTGKSMFCVSYGAQALRQGKKVLHVALEGAREEASFRYSSNLSGVWFSKFPRAELSEADTQEIDKAISKYGDNLIIRNFLDFGVTIEEVISYAKDLYKTFPFDVVIVDYGQLMTTKMNTDGHRFDQAVVHRGLSALSRLTNSVIMTPAQATRDSQKEGDKRKSKDDDSKEKVLRSYDISEAFEISRVAGIILSLNRTDDEVKEDKLRLFLEKQRWGEKGKTFGLYTEYGKCNLITGRTYQVGANVTEFGLDDDDQPKNGFGGNSEMRLSAVDHVAEAQRQADRLYGDILDLNSKLKVMKDQDQAGRPLDMSDEDWAKRMNNVDVLLSERETKMTRIKELMTIVNPSLSKEGYEMMKQSYEDAVKNSDVPKHELEKMKRVLRLLAIVYSEKNSNRSAA